MSYARALSQDSSGMRSPQFEGSCMLHPTPAIPGNVGFFISMLLNAGRLQPEYHPPGHADLHSTEATADYDGPLEHNVYVMDAALSNYEIFHCIPAGAAAIADLQQSSLGVLGWSQAVCPLSPQDTRHRMPNDNEDTHDSLTTKQREIT